jgi:serine/threonine-protein kinase
VVGLAVALTIVAVVISVAVAVNKHTGSSTGASSYPSSYSSSSTSAPTSTYTAPVDPEAAAYQQLQQFAAEDRPFVTAQLADHWIPQLSSKRPGTIDDGVWDNVRTLQEHQQLRQQYNAKLLWSGDWPTAQFDAPDYWVTVVPEIFNDSAGALGWCTNHGFNSIHCYAQLLSAGKTAHN